MQFILQPLAPFDLDLSAHIFSSGDEHIRRYDGGIFWQAVLLKGRPALIQIKSEGTADYPRLQVTVEPESSFCENDRGEAEVLAARLFNLDLDLLPFYDAVKSDAIMRQMIKRLWGLHNPGQATAFEALVDSIIEQQISLKAAWNIQRRLTYSLGEQLTVGGRTYFAFPKPERLAGSTIEELRSNGLSGRKAEYIKGVACLVTDGLDLESYRAWSVERIINELTRLRGVGVWTAEMTAVRGMQKRDAFPAGDLGLQRVISHYYYDDRKITATEARQTAEAWPGWRGLAAYYLVIASMLKIEVEDKGKDEN